MVARIDRHAGIVDDGVDDTGRVGLRHPAIAVDGLGPIAVAGGIDLVDGDDLARLRLGEEVVVVVAPPRRGIAAEGPAGELGSAAGRGLTSRMRISRTSPGSAPRTKTGPVQM